MARPTDQEMMAIEKRVCPSQFPREGGTPHLVGPHGEAPGCAGDRRNKGKHGQDPVWWFLWEEMGKAG